MFENVKVKRNELKLIYKLILNWSQHFMIELIDKINPIKRNKIVKNVDD